MADNRVVTQYLADVSDHVAKIQKLNAAQAGFASQTTGDMRKVSGAMDDAGGKAESFGMRANKAFTAIKAASLITAFAQIKGAVSLVVDTVDALAEALGFVAANWQKVKEEEQKAFVQWKSHLREGGWDPFGKSQSFRERAELAAAATGTTVTELQAKYPGRYPLQEPGSTFGPTAAEAQSAMSARARVSGESGPGRLVLTVEPDSYRNLADTGMAPSVAGGDFVSGVAGSKSRWVAESGASTDGAGGMFSDESALRVQAMQDESDAMFLYQERMGQLSGAFGILSSTAAEGFGAWIDGSKSFGEAAKQMFSTSLRATAMDMMGKSVYHAAAALGSLALGPIGGVSAAGHAKAAAAYAAGAAVVGGFAKALYGAGGAGGGGGVAGGGAPNVGGGAGAMPGTSVTVILGDDWAEESAQSRQRRANRAVTQALRDGAGTEGGIYRG